MIKQLQNYNDIITPIFLSELLDRMSSVRMENWKFSDIQYLFTNQIVDGIKNISGSINILSYVGILQKSKYELYVIPDYIKPYIGDKNNLSKKFIELLFTRIISDPSYSEVFSNKFISFDTSQKSYIVSNNAFSFKFSKFKELLVNFDLLIKHPKVNSYIFNTDLHKSFLSLLVVENNKKISVDEFNESLEQRRVFGEQAENFVFNFEKSRLNSNQTIEWVAKVTVNDGYDIASYDNETDKNFNRFIEVKSYAGNNKYFYLSANELKVSKIKKESYWLYLVNRDKLSSKGYAPEMIQNPHEVVFTSTGWEKEAQSWKFEEIN